MSGWRPRFVAGVLESRRCGALNFLLPRRAPPACCWRSTRRMRRQWRCMPKQGSRFGIGAAYWCVFSLGKVDRPRPVVATRKSAFFRFAAFSVERAQAREQILRPHGRDVHVVDGQAVRSYRQPTVHVAANAEQTIFPRRAHRAEKFFAIGPEQLVRWFAEDFAIAARRARRRADANATDGLTLQLAAVQSASRATHSRLRAATGRRASASVHSGARVGEVRSPIGKHEIAPTRVASTRVASARTTGRARGRSTSERLGARAMDALASRVARLMDRTTKIFVGQLFLARLCEHATLSLFGIGSLGMRAGVRT